MVGLAVAPDGRWLYSLGSPEPAQGRPAELRRWDTRTGEQAGATRELRGQPNSLDVTPDGRLLVLGTDRGVLVLPAEPGSAR